VPSQNSGGGKRRKVQFSELQEVNDLDLDRGLGQGHTSMRITYRTTSMPDHVTAASSSTEIWPFELRDIDIPRSLNSCDSFPIRKFETLTQRSCRPGLILSPPIISFELHMKIADEIDLEKCNFRNFRSFMTLTLTLDRVEVTLVRISGCSLPTHQMRSKSEKLCGRTDGRTDGRTRLSSVGLSLSGHRQAET